MRKLAGLLDECKEIQELNRLENANTVLLQCAERLQNNIEKFFSDDIFAQVAEEDRAGVRPDAHTDADSSPSFFSEESAKMIRKSAVPGRRPSLVMFGVNSSGKTTLVNALVGISLPAGSGRVTARSCRMMYAEEGKAQVRVYQNVEVALSENPSASHVVSLCDEQTGKLLPRTRITEILSEVLRRPTNLQEADFDAWASGFVTISYPSPFLQHCGDVFDLPGANLSDESPILKENIASLCKLLYPRMTLVYVCRNVSISEDEEHVLQFLSDAILSSETDFQNIVFLCTHFDARGYINDVYDEGDEDDGSPSLDMLLQESEKERSIRLQNLQKSKALAIYRITEDNFTVANALDFSMRKQDKEPYPQLHEIVFTETIRSIVKSMSKAEKRNCSFLSTCVFQASSAFFQYGSEFRLNSPEELKSMEEKARNVIAELREKLKKELKKVAKQSLERMVSNAKDVDVDAAVARIVSSRRRSKDKGRGDSELLNPDILAGRIKNALLREIVTPEIPELQKKFDAVVKKGIEFVKGEYDKEPNELLQNAVEQALAMSIEHPELFDSGNVLKTALKAPLLVLGGVLGLALLAVGGAIYVALSPFRMLRRMARGKAVKGSDSNSNKTTVEAAVTVETRQMEQENEELEIMFEDARVEEESSCNTKSSSEKGNPAYTKLVRMMLTNNISNMKAKMSEEDFEKAFADNLIKCVAQRVVDPISEAINDRLRVYEIRLRVGPKVSPLVASFRDEIAQIDFEASSTADSLYYDKNALKVDWDEELAEGDFGLVHPATYKDESGGRVELVVKRAPVRNTDATNKLVREALFLRLSKSYDAPHIRLPKFVMSCCVREKGEPVPCLVLPRMRTSLGQELRSRMDQLTLFGAVTYAHRICSSLAVLHCHGIVHRGINVENILLDEDGQVFLTNIGCAGTDDDDHTGLASPTLAPEMSTPGKFTTKADMWAFGVLVFSLLPKEEFVEPTIRQGEDVARTLFKQVPGETNDSCTNKLINLAKTCLAPNAKDRLTAEEIEEQLRLLLEELSRSNKNRMWKDSKIEGDDAIRERIYTRLVALLREQLDVSGEVRALREDIAEVGSAQGGSTGSGEGETDSAARHEPGPNARDNEQGGSHQVRPLEMEIPDDMLVPWSEVEAAIGGKQPVSGGGSANVYEAVFRGEHVAVKVPIAPRISINDSRTFKREARVLMAMQRNRHILPLRYIVAERGHVALLFPWGEVLDDYSCEHEKKQHKLLKRLLDVAIGLEYLHGNGITHRDLKASNVIVLNDDDGHYAAITDFGSANVHYFLSLTSTSTAGVRADYTVLYAAPEQLQPARDRTHKVSTKSDIWAFGHLVNEVMCGAIPYADIDRQEVEEHVRNEVASGRALPQPHPDLEDARLKELVQKCFSFDPAGRPSALEIKNFFSDLLYGTVDEIMQSPA